MDNQSSASSGTGPSRTTPEKSNPRLPLPEGANETIVTAHHLRMNPVRQLGLGGVSVPPPQTCRKIFDKRYYIQQINNHIVIIDKEVSRMYDQLMHHKLQSTNYEFVQRKVGELSKQFEEKEEYLKILNDVVRLHYLHKGKPIDVSKNITMLRKANKERMENMERIQFFDRKDLERVAEKLRIELDQEDHIKTDIINALSYEDREELEQLTFVKDELLLEKENLDAELEFLRSDISRFEAKIMKDPKMETKYKLRALINEAPEIAEKYKMENKDLESFESQGKMIRLEIETLGTLIEKLEDDMNTDYTDQNRRLAKFREFQRRERIIENFLQSYSNLARDTYEKLSDLQSKIAYGLEYLSATDEEKDPLWDPEEYEYYVNPNLQKEAVIEIIVKLQKQYVWFRQTLDQFRGEINELHKLKRTYTDEIEIFTNYEDIRDEMIDRQNELATLKTSLTRSLESTSAAIVEATGNRQNVEKKIQHNPAYVLFRELQSKLIRLEEKNQKLKDGIDKVVFGVEVEPLKNQCLQDIEELKSEMLDRTDETFLDAINRQIAEAKAAKESDETYAISQIRFFKYGALDPTSDPTVFRAEPPKKSTPSKAIAETSKIKETPKQTEKCRYYSDDDSSPDTSSKSSKGSKSLTHTPISEVVDRKERLSTVRRDLRKEFGSSEKKKDKKDKSDNLHEHLTSVKKDLSKEFELMSPEKPDSPETPDTPEKPNEDLYTGPQLPRGLVFSKDSRIKTTVVSKDKPQVKQQQYRRFSAYINVRDAKPETDDYEEPEEHTERIDTLTVEETPEMMKLAACLSPVREESEKPDETDSERSADIQEEIEKEEIADVPKHPSEDSDSEVIKIEFPRPNDPQSEEYEESEEIQKADPSKTAHLEKLDEEDPDKPGYKGFTICVKEAHEYGLKSPGSARSSAIDDIVTEFALHSKDNSENEETEDEEDSKNTTSESVKPEHEDDEEETKKEDVTSEESASDIIQALIKAQPTTVQDEMKNLDEVKFKKRFTHIFRYDEKKSSDNEDEEETCKTEKSSSSVDSADLEKTPDHLRVLKASSAPSVLEETPSTSPDLEPTPPISPTSEKPPITTPEMDTSSTSPEPTPRKSAELEKTVVEDSSETSESSSEAD